MQGWILSGAVHLQEFVLYGRMQTTGWRAPVTVFPFFPQGRPPVFTRGLERRITRLIKNYMKATLNRWRLGIVPTFSIAASANTNFNKDLIEEYLSWKQSYSKSAHLAYRLWVTRFQDFVNKSPENISHTDYSAFAQSLQGKHASRGIEFALNVVHNYLRFFAEQGRLKLPLYLVRVPKGISNSHSAISEEEYQRIVHTLRSMNPIPLRDLAIIMLLHDTGMRIGELMGLEIDDIESDKSTVVHTEKTIRFRRVYWNTDTDCVLHQYLAERINSGPKHSDLLFATKRMNTSEESLSIRSVQRMFQRVLKLANIQRKLCLHSFRHSFIHRLAKLGVPDAIIAQLVGHSTPLTISHYTKLSRPELAGIARKQLDYAQAGQIAA